MSKVLIRNRPFIGDDRSDSSSLIASIILLLGNRGFAVMMLLTVCAEATVPLKARSTVKVLVDSTVAQT